jgi:hypothetical protein
MYYRLGKVVCLGDQKLMKAVESNQDEGLWKAVETVLNEVTLSSDAKSYGTPHIPSDALY